MDRSDPSDDTRVALVPDRPVAARDDIVVSVCTTCRADSATPATEGPALLAALTEALASVEAPARVRAVQCLGVCKRPVTVAVSSTEGYTFMFGDLDVTRGLQALADFVKAYRTSNFGLVPWRARAEVLRKGMIARLPPAIWSPDNGEPPK